MTHERRCTGLHTSAPEVTRSHPRSRTRRSGQRGVGHLRHPSARTRTRRGRGLARAPFGLANRADKFHTPGHVQPLHVSHESWGDVARTWSSTICHTRRGTCAEPAPWKRCSAPVEASESGSQRPFLSPGQFDHNVEVQTGVGRTRPVCPHRCRGSGEPRGRTETLEDSRTEGASWRTAAVYIVSQPVGLPRIASWVTPLRNGVTVESSTSRCSESGSRSIIRTRPNSPVA